jgi:hypothetical protein
MRFPISSTSFLIALVCATSVLREPPKALRVQLAAAPWSALKLKSDEIAAIYRTQWQKAENRQSCALLVPASLGDGAGATPRAAAFSGGWAVAYDRGSRRSVFGIAGSGGAPDSTTYDAWPNRIRWSDGSSAGYGPEGGTGPNQLAYLRVAGQDCLYNVWSRLGVAHLEFLLSQLRFVE